MESSTPRNIEYDEETRALESLLDIFGSAIDLREIASAFCKAGRNFEAAAEILSESKECVSSEPTSDTSNGESRCAVLSEQLSENISKAFASRNSKASKPRKHSVSGGTVSSFLGKGYSKSTALSNGVSQTTKPVKVNLSEFPIREVQEDDVLLESRIKKDHINTDVEEFLFKMLGEGFQLGMDVIQNVLGSCGYDANKSIEKLVDLSASTLNISDDLIGGFAEQSAGKDSKQKSQTKDFPERNAASMSREVLNSLFNAPDRPEEPPRKTRPVRAVKKTRSYGTVVSEPPIDRPPRLFTDVLDIQKDTDDDVEEEGSYQVLRRVAKEHWITMKEYYKAAVEAFMKRNLVLADELLQKGQFFNNKAREADEKSSQKIFECSMKETGDEMILDVHDHDPKQAVHLLKLHLTSLSGHQSPFQLLKVILETDGENITKGSRRRRVLKFLERESIKWTEEGATITIQLHEIDPEELSFAKKADE